MPTYQYACTECDHSFEQFQSFTDDALTVCPVCEGRLRKVFNAVGVVFKGSGFYRNDSRTDGKSTGGGATPKSPATADSSGSNGSDSSSLLLGEVVEPGEVRHHPGEVHEHRLPQRRLTHPVRVDPGRVPCGRRPTSPGRSS